MYNFRLCHSQGVASLPSVPDGHSNIPGLLNDLGISYEARFRRLGQLSDLNAAIESQAKAVSLAPDGHPGKPAFLNNLGVSYETRFGRQGKLSDINAAIESQEQAVLLTPDDHQGKPGSLNNLGIAYRARFGHLGELSDINKAIELKSQALALTPSDHTSRPKYLNSLGVSYETRFRRLGKLSDLSNAIECNAQAASLTPNDDPAKPGYLSNLGISYETRFGRLGELSDLSKAIESQAQAVSLTPDGHPEKSACLNNLGLSYATRFERLGELPDLNNAIEFLAQAVSLTPDDHMNKSAYLNNLGISFENRFSRLGELPDLNKAVESQTLAVSLAPNDHPNGPGYLSNLGNSHETRFRCLGELSDLDKAIEFQTRAVSLTPDDHPDKPVCLTNLGYSHKTRFGCLGEVSDMQSATSSFREAAQLPAGPPSARFRACRQWAKLASFDTTSSPSAAYHHAMQLLPQLIWVGTTLDTRYELMTEVGDLATEAASYAISVASYDLALEWLEAGRSIVWGQIARFRTPFDQLAAHEPELAHQLRQIGYKLEQAGSRFPLIPETHSNNINISTNQNMVNEANSHVELALCWDKLLANVRSSPGFEDFLCSPRSPQLLGAAKRGPIAVINIHQSRCDALILQPNIDTISHVPLTAFSREMAILARGHLDSLVGPRGFKKAVGGSRLNAEEPRLLDESLKNLWMGVVKPVLAYLGLITECSSDTLPHITWCTTGPLSFLPLHAAGCQDQPRSHTFDHVISSYTPTLSALVLNQVRPIGTSCGILAVGQEDTPGFSSLPCVNDELKAIRYHAHASGYLQLRSQEATIGRVLGAMDQFSWVHMACHGTQNTTDPTQSAFHLHDGPLTLATITKQSFTNKGLAFLSACQTATGDEKMPDEAIHLAAGMLMAGYPSVIGTMWSIADEDGPEVANRVYTELLRDGKMDHTKAAWALHQAVGELRAKVGTKDIARWGPFIHIGS